MLLFHSLRDHLKASPRKIPDNAPAQLRTGHVKAYTKLADYHSHFDQSPYYLWLGLSHASFIHSSDIWLTGI